MTAHQDVAGVVALLRDLAPDDAMPNTRKAMLDAATLIESLESRLAEAMKVIGPFASRDMSDINDCVDNYDMRYQSQWFADATAAARRFRNAGKE